MALIPLEGDGLLLEVVEEPVLGLKQYWVKGRSYQMDSSKEGKYIYIIFEYRLSDVCVCNKKCYRMTQLNISAK